MKKCAYCGQENSDEALRCAGCGGTEFIVPALAAEASKPWAKIAVLEHEVEAERLGVELNNRKIPHVMQSYYDSALDGLYQYAHGWGHVLAPGEYADTILSTLEDIRQSRAESETEAGSEANRNGIL
jgi:hypothetical protein